jgi:peptidoglycan/LPS O-acetylase OafA/YrhL
MPNDLSGSQAKVWRHPDPAFALADTPRNNAAAATASAARAAPALAESAGDRIVALDGLRGVACIIVILSHYFGEVAHGVAFLYNGWAGVELFFCLSGFLIGGILLDNRNSPSYFRTFYTRRAFRIFPIYYVVVSLVIFASIILPFATPIGPVYAYLTYTVNFLMATGHVSGSNWLLPLWTLCVEEQFYILLPLFLYVIPARWRLERVLPMMILLPVLMRASLISCCGAQDLALQDLLPGRMDALFLGVFAAYARRTPYLWKWLSRNNRFLLNAIFLVSAALLGAVAVLEAVAGIRSFDLFGWTLSGICFTGLILMVADGSPEATRFRSPILCSVGTISYCLYLVHQPIAGILHGLILGSEPDTGTPAQLAVTLLAFAASVAAAWLSWVLFERPLLRIGRRWTYARA